VLYDDGSTTRHDLADWDWSVLPPDRSAAATATPPPPAAAEDESTRALAERLRRRAFAPPPAPPPALPAAGEAAQSRAMCCSVGEEVVVAEGAGRPAARGRLVASGNGWCQVETEVRGAPPAPFLEEWTRWGELADCAATS